MKSRAAIFEGVGKPLVIDEIEVDPPRQGEVLVRLQATGLCHTEIWYMSGGDTRTLVPAVLGHEGGGVVQQVGPGVKSLQEGDHVIPLYIAECSECPPSYRRSVECRPRSSRERCSFSRSSGGTTRSVRPATMTSSAPRNSASPLSFGRSVGTVPPQMMSL